LGLSRGQPLLKLPTVRVDDVLKKVERYFEDIQGWIKNSSYDKGDTNWPPNHIRYRKSDKSIYMSTLTEIGLKIQEIKNIKKTLKKNNDDLKKKKAEEAEKIFNEAECLFKVIQLKNMEYKKKSNSNQVLPTAQPKINISKKNPDEDEDIATKLDEIGKDKKKNLIMIALKVYKKKIAGIEKLLPKIEDTKKKDKLLSYIETINENICNYKQYILKSTADIDDNSFNKSLDKFSDKINNAYEKALDETKQVVGGNLFYYNKYIKYKSKYLQLK